MASLDNQQTWVPYGPSQKDCSQGICTPFCPQWCGYLVFPPPPPIGFSDDSDSGDGPTFSPLVIAIIGILASALLLIIYYTVISKYCSRARSRDPARADADDDPEGPIVGSARHDSWTSSAAQPTSGLDESVIKSIWVCKYKRGDGFVDGTDCSVCLSEFREDESLRLLPKCAHAFHVPCIDTWLKSHSNCPLCRANIAPFALPRLDPEPPRTTTVSVSAAQSVGESEQRGEIEIEPVRRSASMDHHRLSIADVLENPNGATSGESSNKCVSSRSRDLHCVVVLPVTMKRSVSSGKGRNAVLPV
ncbi:hypothetical protein QJS10_CPA10g01158 [Acorus calamus]|uniref:RING-type E3 ubiquitin transferase n=1 Tax=Acorus calamus TaxID=4465 RepID=A0AAV9E1V5_ACOCL|nr:hypothetical protein QJS10_CPA10g01158 [Acorus calamus]